VPTHFAHNGNIYSAEFDFEIIRSGSVQKLLIVSRNKLLFDLTIPIQDITIDGEPYSDLEALVSDLIIMQRYRPNSIKFLIRDDSPK
jgi:hypothetical protein